MESIPLWQHQKEAISRAHGANYFGLFFEQGTGKTATVINILREVYTSHQRLLKTLVLCPLIVVENWKREFLKHSRIDPRSILLLKGHQKVRRNDFAAKAALSLGNFIAVTNYEALLMEGVFNDLATWRPDIIVFDESHRLKNHMTKRTKKAISLADDAKYRYILSGTPVLNSPMDIYSQYRALDLGKAFGKNFYIFRAQYFWDANKSMPKSTYFPDWKLKPKATEEMNRLISKTSMKIKKQDCLDLPPLVRQVMTVEMGPEQGRAYREMEKEFITYLAENPIVAELAIVKALRLQQIVSGYAKDVEDNEVSVKKNPRAEALKELLSDLTPCHKVIVWACFKENYRQIAKVCNELGLDYVEVHGEITPQNKQLHVDAFNNDPTIRVLIGHPGSGGIGINLVAASYSIWFSRSFSLEQDQQAEARNYRAGSEVHEKVTRIDLVTPGTIDEKVMEALANKQQIGESLFRDLRRIA